MVLTAMVLARGLQVHNARMRVALDNMSQGLCMFDANERLVVRNKRYLEMYKLPPEVAKPGTSLIGLLKHRVANVSFSHNIDDYRRELLDSIAEGSTKTTEVKSPDGRTILVTNRPMGAAAGWQPTRTSPSGSLPSTSAP